MFLLSSKVTFAQLGAVHMHGPAVFSMEPNDQPNADQLKGTASEHDIVENLIELRGVVGPDINCPKDPASA